MTTEFTLEDSWTLLATDSALIQMLEGLNVWLFAGESIPEPSAEAHSLLTIKAPRYPYPGRANLYGRRAPNSAGVRTRVSVTSTSCSVTRELASGEYVELPANSDGRCFAQLDENEAWLELVWGKTGDLTLINSNNASKIDGPDILYVSFENSAVRISNRYPVPKTLTWSTSYK